MKESSPYVLERTSYILQESGEWETLEIRILNIIINMSSMYGFSNITICLNKGYEVNIKLLPFNFVYKIYKIDDIEHPCLVREYKYDDFDEQIKVIGSLMTGHYIK